MRPKVLKFWKNGCPPCKAISPIVEQVAQENPEVVFVPVNVEEDQDMALQYGVRSVPTLVFLKGDEERNRLVGLADKKQIEELTFLLQE